MGERMFAGKTEDAEAPFLGADFWKKGVEIEGVVERAFDSINGRCYVLKLAQPVEVAGEEWDRVSVGNLTGFRMALQAAKLSGLQNGDRVVLFCTDLVPAKKEGFSPRVNFALTVKRSI